MLIKGDQTRYGDKSIPEYTEQSVIFTSTLFGK